MFTCLCCLRYACVCFYSIVDQARGAFLAHEAGVQTSTLTDESSDGKILVRTLLHQQQPSLRLLSLATQALDAGRYYLYETLRSICLGEVGRLFCTIIIDRF